MPAIQSGQVIAFYLCDVAETIDLQRIAASVGERATAVRLAPKPVTPPSPWSSRRFRAASSWSLAVVLILVLELPLVFMGVMK